MTSAPSKTQDSVGLFAGRDEADRHGLPRGTEAGCAPHEGGGAEDSARQTGAVRGEVLLTLLCVLRLNKKSFKLCVFYQMRVELKKCLEGLFRFCLFSVMWRTNIVPKSDHYQRHHDENATLESSM